MVWVKANVAGKVVTLEGETWAELVKQITLFAQKHIGQRISWGDLYFK